MTAVEEDGEALQYVKEHLRSDREIVMKAVSQDGEALQYAADHLRGDREIVMRAVCEDGEALQYASEEMRGDRELVMSAVSNDWYGLVHATEELKEDLEIMCRALATSRAQKERALGLRVILLSGRHCTTLCQTYDHMENVLSRCAALLGLDVDDVATKAGKGVVKGQNVP